MGCVVVNSLYRYRKNLRHAGISPKVIPLLLDFYPDIVVVWSTTKLCEGRQLLEILSAEFLRTAVGVSLAVGILLLPDRENPDPRACLHT